MNDLFEAAYNNDATAIKVLIANGADPNAQHPRAGTIALQLACQANALEAIEALLSGGANADAVFSRMSPVDGRSFGNHTPLMYTESVAAARLLVDAGAELDREDSKGWTALVCAAHAGNTELFCFLLNSGASTDVRPLHDGKRMSLVELLDTHIDFYKSNSDSLRQPTASERLAALEAVRVTLMLK